MYGEKIRQLRKRAGLSQAELAKMVGVSRPNISFWEKAHYPPLDAIDKVCKALSIELWKFFIDDTTISRVSEIPVKFNKLIQEIISFDPETADDIYDIFEVLISKFQKNNKSVKLMTREVMPVIQQENNKSSAKSSSTSNRVEIELQNEKLKLKGISAEEYLKKAMANRFFQ